MANYNTDKVASTVFPRAGTGTVSVSGEMTVGTALLLNDTVSLFKLPPNAVIRDLHISSSGTQGANSDSVFTVGDSGNTARYITTAGGLCLRSGGGVSRLNAHAGVNYQNTAETTVQLLVTTVGTGQTTTGVIKFSAIYDMQK
jgi:hypothetical protein